MIKAVSFALLAVGVSAPGAAAAADPDGSGSVGDLAGSRALIVLTVMLVVGGAFMILRAAMSHDLFSRRLDNLCRELESSNARLKEFSFKDEVTGLYNRRFFALRLEDEVSRYCRFNHALSVVLLDVDGFKAVNDELGHAGGDETLRGIGDVLLRHSRNIDVVCRYGGDEFAVLLVETSKRAALLYAERIRGLIEATAFRHGRAVTVSVGVGCLPEDVGPVPDDIVTTADWALAEAKRAGKNQVAEPEGAVVAGTGRRGGWDL